VCGGGEGTAAGAHSSTFSQLCRKCYAKSRVSLLVLRHLFTWWWPVTGVCRNYEHGSLTRRIWAEETGERINEMVFAQNLFPGGLGLHSQPLFDFRLVMRNRDDTVLSPPVNTVD
jgi:hypothetical protein